MNLSHLQLRAVELVESGANIFLSGMAGTGKSTVTTTIVGRSHKRIDLCATTGIAALNLQQQFLERTGLHIHAHTIYRYAGIGLGPAAGQSDEDYYTYLQNNMTISRRSAFMRLRGAETVILDEVSMLPGRILDYLDFHFQRVRGDSRPFGGVQLVAVGDFLQLPPVSKTGRYDWVFMSNAWEKCRFIPCYLTDIFRQNEPEFISALNDFRVGRISGDTARVLSRCIARFPAREIPRLFTHNVQVDKWNTYQLENIEGEEERIFHAETNGNQDHVDFLVKNLVTPDELRLKRTARVMFTSNLTAEGSLLAANGECGSVEEMSAGAITVRKDNGTIAIVEPHKWTYDPQDQLSASFTQFPLRLAYSLTIHKSQGLTLDRALIDIRAAREPGQAYVAISRLRNLKGLFLKDWFKGVFVSPEAIEFYRNIEKANALAA